MKKIIILLVFIGTAYSFAQNVIMTFRNIRNSDGQIVIGVYKDDESFKKETPYLSLKFPKKNIVSGVMSINFSLPVGEYGIAILDDEDNNGEMDFGFLGIPQEGYGFSNYEHSGLTRPKIEKFKFSITNVNEKKYVYCKVQYF